jgi:hypothetical protein
MNVRIPAGKHEILFHSYGGEYGSTMHNIRLNFVLVAGKNYKLFDFVTSQSARHETIAFMVCEVSDTREADPDEQLLFVKLEKGNVELETLAHGVFIVLDKGTNEERKLCLRSLKNDLRVVIPKGDHTIDVELTPSAIARIGPDLEPEGEQPRNFTASSLPVKYSAEIKYRSERRTKTTYTLTRK